MHKTRRKLCEVEGASKASIRVQWGHKGTNLSGPFDLVGKIMSCLSWLDGDQVICSIFFPNIGYNMGI